MGKLVRKNLMLDDEKVKELARVTGKSESAAVRELIDRAMYARRIGDALQRLHEMGAFASPQFDYLFDPNRDGPTVEEVEQLPYEDITADLP
jgi:hypothetical protein